MEIKNQKLEPYMSDLTNERRRLKSEMKNLSDIKTHEAAQERARLSEQLRECESNILIERATGWGIEVLDKPEWYSVTNKGRTVNIVLPYLNQKGTAIINHQIRIARFAYWKSWAEILIPILSLIIAILALLKS